MAGESKPADTAATKQALEETVPDASTKSATVDEEAESSGEEDEGETPADTATAGASANKKKKKSKKKKLKEALTGKKEEKQEQLTTAQVMQVLEQNPALKKELEAHTKGKDPKAIEEMMKRMDLGQMLTGLAPQGKNAKDMASYKFWQTQPVRRFDESGPVEQGPIKEIDIERVSKDPPEMYPGFEWVTMDLTKEDQLEEVWQLLANHYVEDDDAMFRFNYSVSFFNWALKAPGWRKEWHVGVRATQSGKLVAFISAIPMTIRVREQTINASEVNFLCVHKKLRSKRLAPVLIKEITRRCYLVGVFQAIYTGGILLPTPVATCRYFHRSLNWPKLYEVGFSPLPPNSTVPRQTAKYKLPSSTSTPGLRRMETKDVPAVLSLLNRYLDRVDMAQIFDADEVSHWLLQSSKNKEHEEEVVWSYVVEKDGKITDFFSYYVLESTVIGNTKHKVVNAAYLFYYATDVAFEGQKEGEKGKGKKEEENGKLKVRLNELVHDALILANNVSSSILCYKRERTPRLTSNPQQKFDVFNALTLLDNPLFLSEQKFGPGDGQLHYYLFNYKCAPILGGVDERNLVSDKYMGGVGVVML